MRMRVNDLLLEALTEHVCFALPFFGLLSCGDTHRSAIAIKGMVILAPRGFKSQGQ